MKNKTLKFLTTAIVVTVVIGNGVVWADPPSLSADSTPPAVDAPPDDSVPPSVDAPPDESSSSTSSTSTSSSSSSSSSSTSSTGSVLPASTPTSESSSSTESTGDPTTDTLTKTGPGLAILLIPGLIGGALFRKKQK